jgi:hypothetical protein
MISTSPLSYQSNSGPTASGASAMKPSSDIDAYVATLPIAVAFLLSYEDVPSAHQRSAKESLVCGGLGSGEGAEAGDGAADDE